MPQFNVNVSLTGFYAFLFAALAIVAWSNVTLATSGVLEIDRALSGIGTAFWVVFIIGLLVYGFSTLD